MFVRPTTYGRILIVGGGCYGSYYVRQLRRARDAGAISFEALLVIDRDAQCQAASLGSEGSDVRIVEREWDAFFDEYLESAAAEPEAGRYAIVPSPLMPHLMFDWLMRRARHRWPRRTIERRGLSRAPDIPWQRAVPSGTHVVSFAEWTCPVNCIEPAKCPAIRAPRTWSMPEAVRRYVEAENRRGAPLAGPVIFHCEHRAYGVGMFDTRAVLAGDTLVAHAAAHDATDVLVGTVSHCHGALDILHVGHGHAA